MCNIPPQNVAEHAFADDVVQRLNLIYEEMMWLAQRENVTSQNARAWYSAVRAESVKRKVRRFSGRVSAEAINLAAINNVEGALVLEHYLRVQASLSELLNYHVINGLNDPVAFVTFIYEHEKVHITTKAENQQIRLHGGCYADAGVELCDWVNIPEQIREILWSSKLQGHVANAADYAPA